MKQALLNKKILMLTTLIIFVGIIIDSFAYSQHKLFKKNKDYIVVLDATISNITEHPNFQVDSNDLHKYTIALTYVYNWQVYTDNYWKDVTGDSFDDINFKEGDTVEIVIFSHTPDKIVSDDPEDIERYLKEPTMVLPYCIFFALFVYIILVWINLLLKNRKNIKNIKNNKTIT